MTETEYLSLAEAVLARIERDIDTSGEDIEIERNGNVLALEFEGGEKIIVNLQVPMREIWLASKDGAFHYRYVEGQWRDTRGGQSLFAALSAQASHFAGAPVVVGAD